MLVSHLLLATPPFRGPSGTPKSPSPVLPAMWHATCTCIRVNSLASIVDLSKADCQCNTTADNLGNVACNMYMHQGELAG